MDPGLCLGQRVSESGHLAPSFSPGSKKMTFLCRQGVLYFFLGGWGPFLQERRAILGEPQKGTQIWRTTQDISPKEPSKDRFKEPLKEATLTGIPGRIWDFPKIRVP